MTGERRLPTSDPSALDALLADLVRVVRRAAREEARQAVQEALRDAPGGDPAYASKPRAARLLGVSAATLRRWQKVGRIRRYEGGRVSLAECRGVLAEGQAPKAAPPVDLATARAQRAAASLLGRGTP